MCKNFISTSRNSRKFLRGILGGGVPPSSPNPDPISNQIMSFSTPVFRPGLWAEIMIRLKRQKKFLKSISNLRMSLSLLLFWNTFIHSRSSLKNHTRFQTKNWQNLHPFSDQKGAKTYPLGPQSTSSRQMSVIQGVSKVRSDCKLYFSKSI